MSSTISTYQEILPKPRQGYPTGLPIRKALTPQRVDQSHGVNTHVSKKSLGKIISLLTAAVSPKRNRRHMPYSNPPWVAKRHSSLIQRLAAMPVNHNNL